MRAAHRLVMPVDGATRSRAREALARFRREYPPRHSFLEWETPFQLLVAVVLSAQSMDKVVNRITPGLFAQFPTAEAMAKAEERDVEKLIHGVSYARTKARHLKQAAARIVETFDGQVPRAFEDLTSLPGVGRKTANVVQGHLWGESEGIAVDTHVARVSQRLALTDHDDAQRIERDLVQVFPPEEWAYVNYYLISHGRAICTARRPLCGDCPVQDLCPKVGVMRPGSDPQVSVHPTRTDEGESADVA